MKALNFLKLSAAIIAFSMTNISAQSGLTYKIVDTGQNVFYNNSSEISAPPEGNSFYGQDAQFSGNQPSYTDNGDGTITDNVTGLMWQKSPDLNGDGIINYEDKLTYTKAASAADTFRLAGYTDWRLPTLKEQYSLINFNGKDPSGMDNADVSTLTPFIDTAYFDFGYGNVNAGERIIDAQFASSTLYTGTTMNGNATMFGVNFADGRIKGYPYEPLPGQTGAKKFYVLYVRGNKDYGRNNFVNNNDGTLTDKATGLMWTKDDSKEGLNWEDALKWVQSKNDENYLGHDDWRLPNVKELQSIVDYSRCPQTTNSPAIYPLFSCTAITDEGGGTNYPFYWSGTTHLNMVTGSEAAYVAFGEALGWMQDQNGIYHLLDVHGAGAQRSDPKAGDPDNYPYGHGPQGDVIRIYNYVRLVRDADRTTSVGKADENSGPASFSLKQNYPNPFNPGTLIEYQIPTAGQVNLQVFDALGRTVATLVDKYQEPGTYNISFSSTKYSLPSGIYIYKLSAGEYTMTKKMVYLK